MDTWKYIHEKGRRKVQHVKALLRIQRHYYPAEYQGSLGRCPCEHLSSLRTMAPWDHWISKRQAEGKIWQCDPAWLLQTLDREYPTIPLRRFSERVYMSAPRSRPRPDYQKLREQLSAATDHLPRTQKWALEDNEKVSFLSLPQEILDLIDDQALLSIGARLALRRATRILFIRLDCFLPHVSHMPPYNGSVLHLRPEDKKELHVALNFNLTANIRSLDCRGILQEAGMAFCGECCGVHSVDLFSTTEMQKLPADRHCRRLRLCPHREISHLDYTKLRCADYSLGRSTRCIGHVSEPGHDLERPFSRQTERESVRTTSVDLAKAPVQALRVVQGDPPFQPGATASREIDCMRFDVQKIPSDWSKPFVAASPNCLWRRHKLLCLKNDELHGINKKDMTEQIVSNFKRFAYDYMCEHLRIWPARQANTLAQRLLAAMELSSATATPGSACSEEMIHKVSCDTSAAEHRIVKEPVVWNRINCNRSYVDGSTVCRCVLEFVVRHGDERMELYVVMTRLIILPTDFDDNFWFKEVVRR